MNYIKALLILFTITLFSCNENKKEQKKEIEKEVLELEGFSLPEGVTSDGKFFYISNVGVEFNPMDKDEDGFISRVNNNGEINELRFLPKEGKLHSPKG